MMHQPVFDYLRTKKALGYIACVREWTRNGISGITINCSSKVDRYSVETVEKKIIESTLILEKQFEEMTEKQFKKSKESYVKFLAKPAKSLKRQFMSNDREVIYGTYRFDREAQEAKKLPEVTLQEFKDFYKGTVISIVLYFC